MDDSGSILCQLSALKDMLDQVNEEIEANYQITREIESEIVKCSEFKRSLVVRESELMKTVYMLQFQINALIALHSESRSAKEWLEEELSGIKIKRDEIIERMDNKREAFNTLCLDFQKGIQDEGDGKVGKLLAEKEYLENEVHLSRTKVSSLQSSMSDFIEEILEGINANNSVMERLYFEEHQEYIKKPTCFLNTRKFLFNYVAAIMLTADFDALVIEIERGNSENDKLVKDINELKTTLLAAMSP